MPFQNDRKVSRLRYSPENEFMDEIDYTFDLNGGTEVTLRKQVGGSPGSTDEEEA